MKNHPSPGLRARSLLPFVVPVFVLGLGCAAPVLAEPLPYVGRWLPDEDPGPPAARTVLTIKDARMTWREPDAPACVRDFALQKERPGTVYRDGRGTKFVAGAPGSIPTYLLKLGPGTCGSPGDYVRISFPLVYDIGHIELIDYVAGKPVAVRRYRRKKK